MSSEEYPVPQSSIEPNPPRARNDERAELRSVLHQWDAINVRDEPRHDPDEYDSLIEPVLTRLSRGATIASLAEYLWFEVRDHLGLDPARSRPDLLAERLVAWYHDRETRQS